MNTPTAEIYERFFEAIAILKSNKTITGLRPFCDEYGFNYTKYVKVKNKYESPSGMNYNTLDIEAFYVLAKDFNISLEWLFFGIGNMFKNIQRQIKDAQVQD